MLSVLVICGESICVLVDNCQFDAGIYEWWNLRFNSSIIGIASLYYSLVSGSTTVKLSWVCYLTKQQELLTRRHFASSVKRRFPWAPRGPGASLERHWALADPFTRTRSNIHNKPHSNPSAILDLSPLNTLLKKNP